MRVLEVLMLLLVGLFRINRNVTKYAKVMSWGEMEVQMS